MFDPDADKEIVGDIVSGGRKDCGIPDGEIGFNAPEYLVDLTKTRVSLGRLLHLEFDVLCFGHGTPVLSNAKDVLRGFVECDDTWEEIGRRQRGRISSKP